MSNPDRQRATRVQLVAGVDPLARMRWMDSALATRHPADKVTVLASSELFARLDVHQQAQRFEADAALKASGVHLMRLAPGCACCSSRLIMSTHLSRTLRLNPPDWLVLELESASHPDKVLEFLQEPQWRGWFSSIELVHTDPVSPSPPINP